MADHLWHYGNLYSSRCHFHGDSIFKETSEDTHGFWREICPVTKDPLVVNEEWASQTWTVRQAIATKPFWLLSLSFFWGSFATQSIFAHQVAFFIDRGLEALFASYFVGIVGVVSIGSKILWGVLSDKIGREVTTIG
jgi:Na+/melibiose symporter-like transporter